MSNIAKCTEKLRYNYFSRRIISESFLALLEFFIKFISVVTVKNWKAELYTNCIRIGE